MDGDRAERARDSSDYFRGRSARERVELAPAPCFTWNGEERQQHGPRDEDCFVGRHAEVTETRLHVKQSPTGPGALPDEAARSSTRSVGPLC
jgi:hypothetical protein